ncbi:MAG: AraC family ligand binding domain-containing protein [Burkholderiaceae bacterium]
MNTRALPDFAAFEAEARRRGFDEVLERHWAPNTVIDTHTHGFGVWAQVSRGEMWLTLGGQTQHLKAGDQFTVAFEAPHAERYGADGASYWVARRNRPA